MKDPEVAKRMTKFVELNTIGVSKDSQLRAARVIETVADNCLAAQSPSESFFGLSYRAMKERWQQLHSAVKTSGMFSVPEFSPGFCRFLGRDTLPQPGNIL